MASATNSKQRRIMIITSDEDIIEQLRLSNTSSSFETFVLESGEHNLSTTSKTFHPISKKNRLQLSANTQSTSQKEIRHHLLTCVVCGSSALGRHFGVPSCESCKLFFRRNGLKDPVRNSFQFTS